MKISIIIPSFNAGFFIERAINSVLLQPYQNKEVIVIDGGSTDKTISILESYGSSIRWISEKDGGQADAINKGFKMATGDILAWINADDYYFPDVFGKVVDVFNSNAAIVLLYGRCRSISKGGFFINNIPPKSISRKDLISKGNTIFQPASFYLRSAVGVVKYLDESLYYWMEYDLYIKLLAVGKSYFLDIFLANFSIRRGQKSDLKNIFKMDKELYAISRKYGGRKFSWIFFSMLFHRFFKR